MTSPWERYQLDRRRRSVNNAGLSPVGSVEESLSMEQFFETNVLGPYAALKLCFPGCAQGSGRKYQYFVCGRQGRDTYVWAIFVF